MDVSDMTEEQKYRALQQAQYVLMQVCPMHMEPSHQFTRCTVNALCVKSSLSQHPSTLACYGLGVQAWLHLGLWWRLQPQNRQATTCDTGDYAPLSRRYQSSP